VTLTVSQSSKTNLRITQDPRLAGEWELVLRAEGLSPTVARTSDGIIVAVPDEQAEQALAALSAYDEENLPRPNEADESIGSAALVPGLAVAVALLLFFFVTGAWNSTVPWFERGSADADRIMHGELWRAVTALTLHADIVHALTNAVGAAVFFSAVFGLLGPGLGSALVLLAGAGGNLINAVLHGSPYLSVGASTSIFAAVGVLGGLGMLRRRRQAPRRRRAWMPIAAALALLAMLGSGGERVDVWAHLCGLLLGGASGIAIGLITANTPKPWIQWACGSATLALLIFCWILALR
jgi:rhomboid protease GluP